jgi:hypothetical protein
MEVHLLIHLPRGGAVVTGIPHLTPIFLVLLVTFTPTASALRHDTTLGWFLNGIGFARFHEGSTRLGYLTMRVDEAETE